MTLNPASVPLQIPLNCNSSQPFHFYIHLFEILKPWNQRTQQYPRSSSLMASHQEDVVNHNRLIDEIMRDNVEAVEELQTETQPEEDRNVEKGNQPEEEEQPEKEITEEEKDFISQEAK